MQWLPPTNEINNGGDDEQVFPAAPPQLDGGEMPEDASDFGDDPRLPRHANERRLQMPFLHSSDGGIIGAHRGPVFAAHPFMRLGTLFANWTVTAPRDSVKPWHLYPAGPPPTIKKKRKAFVVRKERPEEAVHRHGTAGPYPIVNGLSEFRGGRFYRVFSGR